MKIKINLNIPSLSVNGASDEEGNNEGIDAITAAVSSSLSSSSDKIRSKILPPPSTTSFFSFSIPSLSSFLCPLKLSPFFV